MRYMIPLLTASLALVACGAPTTVPPVSNAAVPAAPAPVACAVTADAMYALEAAYNVPAHAYVTADAAGKMTVILKRQVKPHLVGAYDALKDARRYYSAGNAIGFCDAKAGVVDAANVAARLIPK